MIRARVSLLFLCDLHSNARTLATQPFLYRMVSVAFAQDFCVSLIMLCVVENISKQDSSVDVERRQGRKFICHGRLPAEDGHVFLFFLFSPTTVKPPFSHPSSNFLRFEILSAYSVRIAQENIHSTAAKLQLFNSMGMLGPPDTSKHSPWLDRVYCCRASSTNFAQLLYLQRTVSNAKQATLEIQAFSILSVDSVNTTV